MRHIESKLRTCTRMRGVRPTASAAAITLRVSEALRASVIRS